jgi:hypothetical protein
VTNRETQTQKRETEIEAGALFHAPLHCHFHFMAELSALKIRTLHVAACLVPYFLDPKWISFILNIKKSNS